jgi:hypothetical protein
MTGLSITLLKGFCHFIVFGFSGMDVVVSMLVPRNALGGVLAAEDGGGSD